MDPVVAFLGGVDGRWDVVDDDLGNLNLFLEVSGSGENGADPFLNLRSGLEEMVGGGSSHSNELDWVVVCEPHFSNESLEEGSIDCITEEEGSDVFTDG